MSYICAGPIGSRGGFTTLNITSGTVCTGCFKGTLEEFDTAVKKEHGDNEHAQAYGRLISYLSTFDITPAAKTEETAEEATEEPTEEQHA